MPVYGFGRWEGAGCGVCAVEGTRAREVDVIWFTGVNCSGVNSK